MALLMVLVTTLSSLLTQMKCWEPIYPRNGLPYQPIGSMGQGYGILSVLNNRQANA